MRHLQNIVERARQNAERLETPVTAGPSQGGSGADVLRLRVRSEGTDYLVCRTWDGTEEGDDNILVAKPFLLRPSTFPAGAQPDGRTIAHGSTGMTISQTGQPNRTYRVSPPYSLTGSPEPQPNPFGGDAWEIKALNVGDTGVTVGDEVLIYEDWNNDGRRWEEVLFQS